MLGGAKWAAMQPLQLNELLVFDARVASELLASQSGAHADMSTVCGGGEACGDRVVRSFGCTYSVPTKGELF
jgi:hypothetical protein